ncbi:MAG: MFS transporter [Acidobacteria bacterium]|nr:MFS transporter [Acidobacteriota bacterium]
MPQEQPAYEYEKKHIILGLIAIFLVYGTMASFIQMLNIARPKIAADLNGMSLYAWSVSIPGVVSAFVTLLFGKLSDMYGRRIMLLLSILFALIGTVLSAISPNFVFLIFATAFGSLGIGAMMPLVFAVVGDMFPPVERSKWIGWLNAPMGVAALVGPTLGGWFSDNWGWQYIFWILIPLLVVCLILVWIGLPSLARRGAEPKIDFLGSFLVTLASSLMIIGISLGGVTYPWASIHIIGLLGASLLSWILFFRTEYRAQEPVLDPLVLRNRSFNTIALVILLSSFGSIAIMMYFPMFLQGVQGTSATLSGQVITPFSVLMAFIGIPVGYLIARTRRYKWLYVLGFAILTADMFGILLIRDDTPIYWSVLAASLAGVGLGAVPTVNTVVVQNIVPKRLLGAAMGAVFFCLMMGVAICPAILGTAMNTTYAKALAVSLPDGLEKVADEETMKSLADSRVLLSEPDMKALESAFNRLGTEGQGLFQKTVKAIRASMGAGCRRVFLIGAITMLISFLLIITIPEIRIGDEPPPE